MGFFSSPSLRNFVSSRLCHTTYTTKGRDALAPPAEGETYATLEQLIRSVNHHAGPQGYAVVTARTKTSKLGVKRKAWLRCDRGGKSSGPQGQIRKHAASRRINCPFSLIAKRQNERWTFRVVNAEHSHDPTPPETHPALRRLALAEKKNDGVSSPATSTQMIHPAEALPTSGTLDDADKPIDPRIYAATEETLQDSHHPQSVRMRSVKDDLLEQLSKELNPQVEGELHPSHGEGQGQGQDQDQDQDGDKDINLDKSINMDRDLGTDTDECRGTSRGRGAPKACRVVKRREKGNIQHQPAGELFMSKSRYGINSDDQSRDRS